ncbi:MAG: RluA family pseudouridine synthase [Kofleriaceae bacterium]|nr:RluA family pseudouridine synthase [Kofleriaceae bacterium]MCL4228645.1 RluA family pseudouridine synthase [Myxococcales bacterium]
MPDPGPAPGADTPDAPDDDAADGPRLDDAEPAGAPRFTVPVGGDDRVDRVVAARFPASSRRRVVELIEAGGVRVDGRLARKGDRVAAGAVIELARAPATRDDLRVTPDPAAAARLTILHVDDALVVMAKPPGMPSQPLRAGELGTAASGLVALHPECAAVADDPRDGGLVHRLDRGTSGLLVAARTRAAWQALRAAFADRRVDKTYLALVEAAPVSRACEAPLAQRGRRVVVDHTDGLDAHTAWEVVARLGARCLVRCTATTGRMHQVRVHLATCGAPIVGDTLYGGQPLPTLVGFFLHAEQLTLPTARGPLTIVAPLPPDREATLAALAGDGAS